MHVTFQMNTQTQKRIQDYPRFRECTIQTFNDQNKEEKSKSRKLAMTDTNLERCIRLQEKLTYGIFFSVNPMLEGERDRKSVKAIQTWICDIDEGSKESQLELIKNAPLKPSLVVESNHGFHLYYLPNRDLSETEFEDGNWGLKNYYNGDPKVCKDTARVLRIPGYYHMKGEKYMVNYREDLSSKARYSVAQMFEAFPDQVQTTPGREKMRKEYNSKWNKKDGFRTRANTMLNTRKMLEELSGSRRVSGDVFDFKKNSKQGQYQIRVNGKSTSSFIDDKDTIGSHDKGGPYRTDWLERYGVVDWSALAKYLKKHHPEIDDKPVEKKKSLEDEDIDIFKDPSSEIPEITTFDFTWGDDMLDVKMGMMKKGQLVILLGEACSGKSTFATFMASKNKDVCCYYVLEDSIEEIGKRYAYKRAGIDMGKLKYKTWTEEEKKVYRTAYSHFRSTGVKYKQCDVMPTIEQLEASMLNMKKKGCSLFVIDNLGRIAGQIGNEADKTREISAELLGFCKAEDVCILLIHHYKKKQMPFADRDIGEMRGSGKLIDDAFTIVELSRDDGRTYLTLKKDRFRGNNGAVFEIEYTNGWFEFVKEVKMYGSQ